MDSLIKREIDAREWFVFCDSPAAEQSPYVRDEHAYIIESGKENVWTIDMTADIDVILNKVRKICTDIEVFVSYVWKDREKAQSLIRALVKKDYSVWTPDDALTNGGDSYRSDISDAITRCAYKGFFVILITPDSVSSSFVAQELAAAYSQGASIIPVVLGNPLIPDNIDYYIRDVQRITVRTENDFAQVVDMLNSYVKENIMNNS